MNTIAIQRDVAALLVPLGIAGAAIAVASVVLTCVILVIRGEEIGLPVAGWIIGTMLSLAAAYSDLKPAFIAAAAGAALAVFGLVIFWLKRARTQRMLSGHTAPRRGA